MTRQNVGAEGRIALFWVYRKWNKLRVNSGLEIKGGGAYHKSIYGPAINCIYGIAR